ncbi:hypothetical protein D3C72_2549100 [compost metagenome]
MADSILSCDESTEAIACAMARALSPEFQASAARARSLYGDGQASLKIKDVLSTVDINGLLHKRFNDLNGGV